MAWLRSRRFSRTFVVTVVALLTACGESGTATRNPTPGISTLTPTVIAKGLSDQTLTVRGSDFVVGSRVLVNGRDRATEFVTAEELRATILASDLATIGAVDVTVTNPAPGGGTSNAARLTIGDPGNPSPSITTLLPSSVTAGSGEATVTLQGTGFLPITVIILDDQELEPTFRSASELSVAIPPALLAASRTASVRARNPQPGGGSSAPAILEIRGPTPTVSGVDPSTAAAGVESLEIRVSGDGFVTNSVVVVDGRPVPTRFVSATLLQGVLDGERLEAPGARTITVRTPAPGGGTSGAVNLVLGNSVPRVELLPSQGAVAGSAGYVLTVHGHGFVAESKVRWNGAERPTEFTGPTRLKTTLSATDLATPGAASITVHTPAPAGGESTPVVLEIRPLPAATLLAQTTVPLRARDMAYSSRTGLLYISVAGLTPYGNTIVSLDPTTGAVVGSVFVGSNPDRLAVSDDGLTLYVGLNGASAVRRVDLDPLVARSQWSLPIGTFAGDIAVVPGEPSSVAVAIHADQIPPLVKVVVYDDGHARREAAPGHVGPTWIEFLSDPGELYGFDGNSLYTIRIDSAGAHLEAESGGLLAGPYLTLTGAGGRLYGTVGHVVDGGMKERVGLLPVTGPSAIDVATGRAYVYNESAIHVIDLNTLRRLAAVPLPGIVFDLPADARARVVRWGADGLAFIDENEVFIIRSPIFAP